MEKSMNRILDEINQWNSKIEGFKDVFGKHISDYRYLVREKLSHFKEINEKYKTTANHEEKITSKILKAEILRLEKVAFPNRIERIIRKTIEAVGIVVRKFQSKSQSQNQLNMKSEVTRKTKVADIGSTEMNLSKTVVQYKKNIKASTQDDLLPKLRTQNNKGLKM